MSRDDAIREEQRHVDRAYDRLEFLRALSERRRREALGVPVVTFADLVNRDAAAYQAAARTSSLTLGDLEALVFGRLDMDDGERFHVGRVSVLTEDKEALVVDWRSPVGSFYYRATPTDPQGVRLRRAIQCAGRRVLTVDDQLIGADAADEVEGEVFGDAALMAALTRQRSAHMRDIVATIQAEQDEIIRLPARGTVLVTGGPGTGKTAVALHRIAYLLYADRERYQQRGVLVVGPTGAFLDYIATVLPSLGETSAVLRSLGDFVDGTTATRHDAPGITVIKGDVRMARVIGGAVDQLDHRMEWRSVFHRMRAGEISLARAARGILSDDELTALTTAWRADHDAQKPPTFEDVPILDEIRDRMGAHHDPTRHDWRDDELTDAGVDELRTFAELNTRAGPSPRILDHDYDEFAHVVVDEAQDLSAMQWRMVARRGGGASWTVVGDLAQRSQSGAPGSWDEITRLIGRRDVTLAELTVNYRTPSEIMDLAAEVLEHALPGHVPPTAVRSTGSRPTRITGVEDAYATAAAEALRLRGEYEGTIAILAATDDLPDLATALAAAVAGASAEAGFADPARRPRLLDATSAKGLEFDAVVVVKPEDVVAEHPNGWNTLYVALTRATQSLTLVTDRAELPPPL